jgi:hypothetical protein
VLGKQQSSSYATVQFFAITRAVHACTDALMSSSMKTKQWQKQWGLLMRP